VDPTARPHKTRAGCITARSGPDWRQPALTVVRALGRLTVVLPSCSACSPAAEVSALLCRGARLECYLGAAAPTLTALTEGEAPWVPPAKDVLAVEKLTLRLPRCAWARSTKPRRRLASAAWAGDRAAGMRRGATVNTDAVPAAGLHACAAALAIPGWAAACVEARLAAISCANWRGERLMAPGRSGCTPAHVKPGLSESTVTAQRSAAGCRTL